MAGNGAGGGGLVTWWKVDDALHSHPKWLATPPRARALWVTAGSWCASHLTDGFVPTKAIATFDARQADARALVKSGLWEVVDGGYRFHGFAKYQPTKEEVEAVRAAARERARAARATQVRANVADPSRHPTRPDPTYTRKSSSSPKESPPRPAYPDASAWLEEHRSITPSPPPPDLRKRPNP